MLFALQDHLRPSRIALPQAALLGVSLMGVAPADEVIMRNGDRLSGDVVRQDNGQLQLETDYAGTLLMQIHRSKGDALAYSTTTSQ